MKSTIRPVSKLVVLIVLAFFSQAFSGKGGDYYKVLLNGKLIAEQYLTQPVRLKTLALTPANETDKLTVLYSHCGKAGSARVLSLKDDKGKVIKLWKFADSPSQSMQVNVKDVLNVAQSTNTVLYYSSKEIPSGEMIINFDLQRQITVKR
jgi:hypothetical protein